MNEHSPNRVDEGGKVETRKRSWSTHLSESKITDGNVGCSVSTTTIFVDTLTAHTLGGIVPREAQNMHMDMDTFMRLQEDAPTARQIFFTALC